MHLKMILLCCSNRVGKIKLRVKVPNKEKLILNKHLKHKILLAGFRDNVYKQ